MKKWLAVGVVLGLFSLNIWAASDEIKVGPQTPSGDNAVIVGRAAQDGTFVSQDGHSRYQEASLRGNSYTCANLGGTAVTTQAGLSLTTPALMLYNPVGSGINMVVNTWTVNVTTGVAVPVQFMLAITSNTIVAPTLTTAATITKNVIGQAGNPNGGCYRVSTLPVAPVAVRYIGTVSGLASVVGTSANQVLLKDDIGGELVLAPGASLSLQTSAAASVVASASWEEVSTLR